MRNLYIMHEFLVRHKTIEKTIKLNKKHGNLHNCDCFLNTNEMEC